MAYQSILLLTSCAIFSGYLNYMYKAFSNHPELYDKDVAISNTLAEIVSSKLKKSPTNAKQEETTNNKNNKNESNSNSSDNSKQGKLKKRKNKKAPKRE